MIWKRLSATSTIVVSVMAMFIVADVSGEMKRTAAILVFTVCAIAALSALNDLLETFDPEKKES